MGTGFSYRHLYYFWVVAKEGGMARAAARLGMAVQTVSTQVRELERSLGYALFKPAGRGVALTEAGIGLVPVLATIGIWGATHLDADPTLAAAARQLASPTPDSWAALMAELREIHLPG